MKLKSSNTYSVLLLSGLIVMVLVLMSLKSNKKKPSKYPKTPEIAFENKTELDVLKITINEKAFKKIKKKRDQAMTVGILETEDSDYVPATINYKGEDFKAEIRLKGDWTTHLEGEKWSFRVKLKGDKTILGMRKFSLHHPKTRRYLNEWLYHRATKAEELMGLRYNFVESRIHIKTGDDSYVNKDVGVYALEETFDKRTIESNKRKESIILKFSEDYWWNEVKESNAIANQYGMSFMDFLNSKIVSTGKYPITVFSESKVLEDSVMHSYFKLGKNLLEDMRQNKINISDAFDVKKLAMDNALMNLFGAIHGTHLINVRYYYNPITSKLEPITFDGNSGVKLTEFRDFAHRGKTKDIAYLTELAYALNKVSQPSYVTKLIQENKKDIDHYTKNLKKEFRGVFLNEENLRYNQTIIRKELEALKKELQLTDLDLPVEPKTELKAPDLIKKETWKTVGVDLVETTQKYRSKSILNINRRDKNSSAFIKVSNIEGDYSDAYKVTINVKKGDDNSDHFGLRMIGVYPNRVDAVYDLETKKVKGVTSTGSFESEGADIKDLGNGWYQCTLWAKPNINTLNIIFGPTDSQKPVIGWEGKSNILSNIIVTSPSIDVLNE